MVFSSAVLLFLASGAAASLPGSDGLGSQTSKRAPGVFVCRRYLRKRVRVCVHAARPGIDLQPKAGLYCLSTEKGNVDQVIYKSYSEGGGVRGKDAETLK